jgi:hypothetical protein
MRMEILPGAATYFTCILQTRTYIWIISGYNTIHKKRENKMEDSSITCLCLDLASCVCRKEKRSNFVMRRSTAQYATCSTHCRFHSLTETLCWFGVDKCWTFRSLFCARFLKSLSLRRGPEPFPWQVWGTFLLVAVDCLREKQSALYVI